MKRIRKGWILALLLLLAGAVQSRGLDKPPTPPKDLAEAEKWFQKAEQAAGGRDYQFDMDNGLATYKSNNGTITVALASVNWIGGLETVQAPSMFSAYAWKVHWRVEGDPTDWWIRSASKPTMEQFQQGLLYLVRVAEKRRDELEAQKLAEFKPKAEAWRALAVKPEMSDDAYPHKVLAESAYKEKNLDKAMVEYEKALGAFPTWPEGQFNEALIAAEQGHYWLAVHRMKEYLLLVPDAPDAKAAKDNIIIWQDKIVHF